MKAADTTIAETAQQMIINPILRGFNPDPCILRVGEMYYIVVSSFEWLPGVRVYESRDLVEWTYCTDVLTDQVDLRGNPKNCSIWAPQLSYRDDRFYLLYTDVKSTKRPFKDDHNYLITAPDIRGPWSEPVYLNSSGFDPSLFHDDDGRKWLLNALWDYRITEGNKSSGIVIQEYDHEQGRLIGEPVKLFDCTPLKKTEAPHIYKKDGYYYLITAEGGTGSGHSVTVARSRELLGPYKVDPHNPMMTSSSHPDWPLQCAGHGSLVETPDGEWYMAHLCTRPVEGQYAILGRETALQQVYWDEQGWLRLTGGGHLPHVQIAAPRSYHTDQSADTTADLREANGTTASTAASDPAAQKSQWTFEDSFDSQQLRPEWNTLRILADESWCSLTARPGYLRLTAGESIQTLFHHHLLALRQQDKHFRAETALEYDPQQYLQMAGLLLYLNEDNYLYAYVSREDHRRVIRLMKCAADQFSLLPEYIVIPDQGVVHLGVEVHETQAQFYYGIGTASDQPNWQPLYAPENIHFLSGGFTGNFVGIAAHDMYQFRGSHADFSHFRYQGQDR
ncbi:glycoside hydrolase family 43 protein [Paenibacillus dauci]|uniref:glycoside hydrolase family 43 protein n=1 Tax=Paenibacillus dauci TaxID=1567106 RepID=UPI000A72B63C|nr:glycoside hydrolase family 43 protein [Paenibacillus dauci]